MNFSFRLLLPQPRKIREGKTEKKENSINFLAFCLREQSEK